MPAAPAAAHDAASGPPYPEHPTSEPVRARAREQARALVSATRHEPGSIDPWPGTDADLDAVIDLVLASAWGTFSVAVAAWESDQEARAGTPAPAPVPVPGPAKARSRRTAPPARTKTRREKTARERTNAA